MKTCCVYSTGVLSIIILIAGIAMVLAQVFQTLVYNRIKRVSKIGADLLNVLVDCGAEFVGAFIH